MPKHYIETNFDLIEVKATPAVALLDELMAEGYDGPVTAAVRDQLWLYGWVNLHSRLRDGSISRFGWGPGAREITPRHLEQFELQETRDELTVTTLLGAVPKFLANLQAGKYDPDRDTTIASFFLTYALVRFRTIAHPKWADDTLRRNYELGEVQPWDEWYNSDAAATAFTSPDHADAVADYLAVRRAAVQAVKKASLLQRPVVLGVLRGKTHPEIAAELGITPKAVEHRLASFRQKFAWTYRPKLRGDQDVAEDEGPWNVLAAFTA